MDRNRFAVLVISFGACLWLNVGVVPAQSAQDRAYPEGFGAESIAVAVQSPTTAEKREEGRTALMVDGALAPSAGLTELYFFSGLTDDGQKGAATRKEATSIHCSNSGTTNAALEVQLYQWSGALIYTGSVTAAPGASYTFSTQNTTIYFDDVIFGTGGGTDSIFQGHGRINSDSGNVICSAQALDPLNYPPQFITNLRLFRFGRALKPSGLPMSSGGKTVRYFISGLTDDGQKGAATRKEATSIHCSNIGTTNAALEVQLYQWSGAMIYTGSVTAAPGASYTFSTQNTTIYFDDVIFGTGGGTDSIFQGHGRVLSDSRDVICTAQVLDPLTYPPVYASELPIYDEYGYPAGGSRQRAVYFPIVVK